MTGEEFGVADSKLYCKKDFELLSRDNIVDSLEGMANYNNSNNNNNVRFNSSARKKDLDYCYQHCFDINMAIICLEGICQYLCVAEKFLSCLP